MAAVGGLEEPRIDKMQAGKKIHPTNEDEQKFAKINFANVGNFKRFKFSSEIKKKLLQINTCHPGVYMYRTRRSSYQMEPGVLDSGWLHIMPPSKNCVLKCDIMSCFRLRQVRIGLQILKPLTYQPRT